jgi:hypothetical protein
MADAQRSPGTCVLDTHCTARIWCAGLLAGSPRAAILADPLICKGREEVAITPFVFDDIPDIQFRKPKDVLARAILVGEKH